MPIATWTHGGSPLFTDIATNPPAGVVANGDLTAAAVTWDATNNENGDTGTVAITSEVSPGNIATVQVLVQLFDDGSFTAGDTLNTLQIVFDWHLTNGPMGTATAASAFNSTCDATDDPHVAGSSTGTYDRTDTGANLGVPTIGDLLTAVSIGGAAAIGFSCIFTYSGGTFSNHNRRLAVSNLQIVANYGSSTVTDIAPDTGPVLGGQVVTITGTGLTGVTEVNFITGITSTPATGIVVAADGLSLTCVTPPCLFVVNAFFFGPYDVEVVGVGTLSGAYTYIGVVKVMPAQGSITGGQAVTITGSGFNAATNVKFGGNAVTSFVIVSNTKITTTTPFHRSGVVDVEVVGVATGSNLYTYSTNRGFATNLPADAFRLPPVPVASPVAQSHAGALSNPSGRSGVSSGATSGGSTAAPMELSNQKWLMEVKRTLESVPFMEWGAEQVIGVLDPDQIPQLPFSRIDFDHSPRLLGRTSDGAGAAEEIQVGPTLTLADGLLSIAGLPTGYTIGDLLYADTDHSLALLNDVSAGSYLRSGGVATAPLWSTLKLPNAATTGDLPYASATNVVSMLADVSVGSYLRSGGVATAPLWSTLKLPNAVTAGSIVFASATDTYGQDNANLFWDDANDALGIGTNAPLANHRVTMDSPAANSNVLRWRNGTATRYRSDVQISSAGLQLNAFDDTAVVTLPMNYVGRRHILQSDVSEGTSIGSSTFSATAQLHIGAGTTAVRTAPLKFTSGPLMTAAEAGAIEFLTDDWYATITTGAARKSFVLTDGTLLTSGRVPFATTNGRLIDSANLTFAGSTLTVSGAIISDTPTLVVDAVNHRVGIGTASPARKLEIVSGSAFRFRNAAADGYDITQLTTNSWGWSALTATSFFNLQNSHFIVAQGNIGIGTAVSAAPTALLQIKAGTASANTAPLKFTSGTLLTTAEAGAVEFLTDDYYATITTGAARKGIVLNDGTALTSGRVPIVTTNGRLTDDADMTFATDTLTVTKIVGSTSITDSGLTAGRVTFAGTGGLLTDDADLTFATDTLTTTKLTITNKLTSYNGVTTSGWGLPAIQKDGRSTAQTAAVASVAAYTVGAADGSFVVDANVNVTTSTTHNFTVAVDYTDETNTAQTLTLTFSSLAGVLLTNITNVTGAGPYEGLALHIRCKASTAITVKTVGTFTTVTYNVEANIRQVA